MQNIVTSLQKWATFPIPFSIIYVTTKFISWYRHICYEVGLFMNNLITSNCNGSNLFEMLLHVSGLQYAIESQVPSACMYCLCKAQVCDTKLSLFSLSEDGRVWEQQSPSPACTSWLKFAICKVCYLQNMQHANVSEDAPYKRGRIKHKTVMCAVAIATLVLVDGALHYGLSFGKNLIWWFSFMIFSNCKKKSHQTFPLWSL